MPVIDDNEMVPVDMDALLELEKVKVIVSEEALLKGDAVTFSVVFTVTLPFTGVDDDPPDILTELTELGIPVKTKFIEILGLIVLLHVLLLYALFDKTTEFEAELEEPELVLK